MRLSLPAPESVVGQSMARARTRFCAVCGHRDLREIDDLLLSGYGPADVLQRLGIATLSEGQLYAHRRRHLLGIRDEKHALHKGCAVCAHSAVEQIDTCLRHGMRPFEIVSGLGLNKAEVGIRLMERHRRGCLGLVLPRDKGRPLGVSHRRTTPLPATNRPEQSVLLFPDEPTSEESRREKERLAARQRGGVYRRALRLEVLREYGGRCACCGEEEEAFLCVDHVNNDGAAHRRSLGQGKKSGAGWRVYLWLKQEGFPREGYRLLCHNCNAARQIKGVCPHESVGLKSLVGRQIGTVQPKVSAAEEIGRAHV